MSFPRAQRAYLQLRRLLSGYVSDKVLPDITVDPPKRDDDELAFIRLVAWSYIVLHEAGKLTFGILRHLPPLRGRSGTLLPHVRALRTWTSHNLAFGSKTDSATIRAAAAWFHSTCGTGAPSTNAHWARCFAILAEEMGVLLEDACKACDAFASTDDAPALKDEFLLRLERNWEAFRFDAFVAGSAELLGFDVDVVPFRNERLKAWREVVEASQPDAINSNLRKRVEADLLDLMANAAPVTAAEAAGLLVVRDIDALRNLLRALRASPPVQRAALVAHIAALPGEPGKPGKPGKPG